MEWGVIKNLKNGKKMKTTNNIDKFIISCKVMIYAVKNDLQLRNDSF